MEYPKALYLDGLPACEYMTVQTAEQEAKWRAQGFRMITDPPEEKPVPRKRKTKGE